MFRLLVTQKFHSLPNIKRRKQTAKEGREEDEEELSLQRPQDGGLRFGDFTGLAERFPLFCTCLLLSE